MKYHIRTVTWKFAEARDVLPELKASQNIQITDPEMLFCIIKLYPDRLARVTSARLLTGWLDKNKPGNY